jgi:hypothetical protein
MERNTLNQLRSKLKANRSLVGKKPSPVQMRYMFDLAKKVGMYSAVHSAVSDASFDAEEVFQIVSALEEAVDRKHKNNPEDYMEYLRHKEEVVEQRDTDQTRFQEDYKYDYYKKKAEENGWL